jgi:hypothetical protein
LLVATLALSLASCGGDGDEPEPVDPERPQITQARLIEQGDAICRRDVARASARLERLPRPARTARIGAIIRPILEINEQAIRSGVRRIEALGRPRTGLDALDDYLDERTTAANALRAALRAARRENMAELDVSLKEYNRNEAQAAASRFGFKVCGLGAGRRRDGAADAS